LASIFPGSDPASPELWELAITTCFRPFNRFMARYAPRSKPLWGNRPENRNSDLDTPSDLTFLIVREKQRLAAPVISG